MGVSSRVTNDNERCQLERQTRVCMIRPCGAEQEKEIKVSGAMYWWNRVSQMGVRLPRGVLLRFAVLGTFE